MEKNRFMMRKEHAYEHSQVIAQEDTRSQRYCRKRLSAYLETVLVVDVIWDMAVDARASPSDHITLGDDAVGAGSAERNIARNSAVVDITDAESVLVDADD
jgi:hypothetical protein